MGKIKKILENELIGGTQSTDVYPVTSTQAVYDENNRRLSDFVLDKNNDVVNDLTTGGTNKVLSAEMGKMLGEEIYNIEEVDKTIDMASALVSCEIGNVTKTTGGISADGTPSGNTSTYLYTIKIDKKCSVYFLRDLIKITYLAFSYIKNSVQSGRYRMNGSSEYTLPSIDESIELNEGDTIYLSGAINEIGSTNEKDVIINAKYTNIKSSLKEELNELKEDTDLIREDVAQQRKEIGQIVSEDEAIVNDLINFADNIFFGSWLKVIGGISADGSPSTTASNYRYEIVLTKNITIYFDSSAFSYTYLAFSYIKNGVQSARYRKQGSTEDTLPMYDNKITLSAGDTIYISVSINEWNSIGDKGVIFGIEYTEVGRWLNPEIEILLTQISGIDSVAEVPEMFVKKTENEIDIYIKRANRDYVKYPIVHAKKDYIGQTTASAFYDCWGITEPCLATLNKGTFVDGMTLFYSSEAELTSTPPNYLGNAMAVGGKMHGYENIVHESNGREFLCLVDNVKREETSSFELTPANEVDIMQHTYLYQVGTNTNPYAIATKRWHFKDGALYLTASLKFIRSISVTHIYSGLMGVLRHVNADNNQPFISNSAIKSNKPFITYDVSNASYNMIPDKDCKKITMYGDIGVGFSSEILDSNMADSGGMFVSHNNNPYNKIYFQIVGTLTASEGDEYHATSEWRIL